MDNYEISRDRAQTFFLNFDQQAIIRRWNLMADETYIFVEFLGRSYRISRNTGRIDRLFDGRQAAYSEVLSIFDLLCHKGERRLLTGKYAPVNSLRGTPVSVGVDGDFHGKTARFFDENLNLFKASCEAIGGKKVDMGDIGYVFPVFDKMQVVLKFYRSDEEFPASITFLWDENTLDFIFYETVFYIAGFLLEAISNGMKWILLSGREFQ